MSEERKNRDKLEASYFDPLSEASIMALRQAIRWSWEKQEVFRKKRLEFIREFVGYHYSDNGASDRIPINLLELALSTYRRHLVSSTPQVYVKTPFAELKSVAWTFELSLNKLFQKMHLEKPISDACLNALFLMGILRTGVAPSGKFVEIEEGKQQEIYDIFVESISPDDWFHDMAADSWEKIFFCGHQARVPFEEIVESGLYENTDDLEPTSKHNYDELGNERAERVSRGTETDKDEYIKMIDIIHVYLPYHKLYLVFPKQVNGKDGNPHKPIRIIEWDKDDNSCWQHGPYHILGLGDVPDQVMPLAPITQLLDIHDLANRLFRKLGRQSIRQKTILGYGAEAMGDAERIVEAQDGQAIKMLNPDAAKEFRFGGIERETHAFLVDLIGRFSWRAGNLDTLAGLSSMAETLGQEQILSQSSALLVRTWQKRVIEVVEGVVQDVAEYHWNDELIVDKVVKQLPDSDRVFIDTFSADTRLGDFLDYNVKLNVHSIRQEMPDMTLQQLGMILTQFIAPFIQMMQMQGVAIDFAELFNLLGRLTNMTAELRSILKFVDPKQALNMPRMDVPRPSITRREHVRINAPSSSRSVIDQKIMDRLMRQAERHL